MHATAENGHHEAPISAPRFDRLNPARLSDEELIDALVATERLVRHALGQQTRVLGALAARQARENSRTAGVIESEVIAATRWAANTAQRRLHEAGRLSVRFPEALALLCAGQVSWPQALALVETTDTLDRKTARAVQARVLPRMPGQSPATTRKALRRAVLAADPEGAHRRHTAQAARRRLELRPEDDGMATIALYTTAQTGTAIMTAVTRQAGTSGTRDPRTLDQRRADALARLVFAGAGVRHGRTQDSDASLPGTQVPALVHVTVGIDTLLGADQEPAELTGYGPIGAGQARALAFAEGSVWRRLLTAPDGTLLHTDPTTYRPTASVARLVRVRDQHCSFPGCSMPAARCDVDHIEPFDHADPASGGLTTAENLQALCRRHHRLKTAGQWIAERRQARTVWTSTTSGRVYETSSPGCAAA